MKHMNRNGHTHTPDRHLMFRRTKRLSEKALKNEVSVDWIIWCLINISRANNTSCGTVNLWWSIGMYRKTVKPGWRFYENSVKIHQKNWWKLKTRGTQPAQSNKQTKSVHISSHPALIGWLSIRFNQQMSSSVLGRWSWLIVLIIKIYNR